MKKYLLSIVVVLSTTLSQAQETTTSDALRYAMDDINGTARFRGMSGAFGAVGGDLSAINVNPAGSAIFNYNFATGTLSNLNTKNNSNYFGSTSSDNENVLDINQLGVVFVFNNKDKSDWKKLAVAINYENTKNLENSIFSRGTNPTNSISDYFLNFANTANGGNIVPVSLLNSTDINYTYTQLASLPNGSYPSLSGFDAQQAFLGYQAYLFDYNDGTSTNPTTPPFYQSNVPSGANYYQTNTVATTGYNGKVTLNLASQYKEILYLGLNLNAHFTDFKKSTSITETNNSVAATRVQGLQFDNDLYTYGGGFSFNLGLIAKLTKDFRAGLAYESPTWYRLNDELSQRLIGYSIDSGVALNPDYVDPGVINIYDAYKIQTPGKLTGSLAYIFGKRGLISFDYSLKDYSSTKFKPETSNLYTSLNRQMSDELTSAAEFRVGLEYKIKQVSLRGGYRFEESPYKNGRTIDDLTGYSAGLGYNFGGSRLDLGYSFAKRDMDSPFISSGMNDTARIKTKNNNIVLSYSLEF
jgi:outer membrane protein transport protein (OMPP1/FadL/TodX)